MFEASQPQAWRSTWASTQPKIGFACSRDCVSALGLRGRDRTNPLSEDKLARCKINNAVAAGTMIRPERCTRCGTIPGPDKLGRSRIHAHHPDHKKPFEVVWLCYLCHIEITPKALGNQNSNARFTPKKVRRIRELWKAGKNGPELAARFGVTRKAIYDVIHRRTWGHVQ